ncbi:hypothetical protein PR048_021981 [Dryococelus australis]|uniref:MADF domain-containing protein n=1 Tax=Dryococelus australis TaxID=614101 RepID=A0ABQ9GZT1_9NEOP|nr:hypothetical protein PR048_021981 [Dryococelus australis]
MFILVRVDQTRGKIRSAWSTRGSIAMKRKSVQLASGIRAYLTCVMMERFHSELLIDEVEKIPAMWDLKCTEYSNKIAKKRAWQELVDIFENEEDTVERKTLLSK